MGFRFTRRIKIMPGVTLNLSKSGITTSIGTRGARVTLGRGKRRYTVGIPGTGISYSAVEKTGPPNSDNTPPATDGCLTLIIAAVLVMFLLYLLGKMGGA